LFIVSGPTFHLPLIHAKLSLSSGLSELARPKQSEEETVLMRFAYAPFVVLGITFIALGASSGSSIYLPLGIVFLIIGLAVMFKRRRT
jgi:hypothetical protein